MIDVQDLHKSYGDIVAVDGITFQIEPGETFGLLGPNGAGKTTTIHMLVGALSPDSGTIRIDGAQDPTQPLVRNSLGIAPQALSLYHELTGLENLNFFGRLYGMGGRHLKKRVEDALKLAGLTDRGGHRVGTYSGGMQRRLNLACALIHEPKVLLLDEPTAGVDPQSRNHLFERIEQLAAEGRTILYTTHYMEEAQRLCDRVAIIDHGELLDLDTVQALIKRHGGDSVVTAELERPPPEPGTLPGTLDGTTLRFQSAAPLDEIGRLAADGNRFSSLKVDQPDLESVFLKLTGRRLRD